MPLSGAEIREKFISYFRDKRGHLHLPSSSLIPDNPTLLLTSAGMVQFVPIFLGQAPAPQPPRVVTVQKCARAGGKDSDIENVGRTARHHSFFEMLGNFSFGDYFKKEVIPWAWEFVTRDLGLDPEKLSVTIFKGDEQNPPDDEAYDIWNKVVGVPAERIYRMSRKDNFWGPPGPTGPCGPCSEIYYDRGPSYGCSDDPQKCGIGICECDRYLEFWNLVFMELYKDENGAFTPLARKNVDTGSGLERVALILQNKDNSYESDLFFPILQAVSKISGTPYTGGVPKPGDENLPHVKKDAYLKIISDHTRSITFLVADGVRNSNIGRGYVLRFITRRAARFGRLLGLTEPFLYKLVPIIVENYGKAYPELAQNEQTIATVIKDEEERFAKTIDRGTSFLNELLDKPGDIIGGAEAFNLYATYGFPIELTREIAAERGKNVDMDSFASARKEHEEKSSVGKFNVNIAGGDSAFGQILKDHGQTKFTGYKTVEDSSEIIAVLKDGKPIDHAEEGDEVDVILSATPFYAESGGQVGDSGILKGTEATLAVLDTKKHEGLFVHKVRALSGVIEPGQKIQALVDRERRNQTMLHHSAAHVFHAAVRDLFGKHVVQAGSEVSPKSMRFDFTLDRQPTQQELIKLEGMMNEWVRSNLPVKTNEMPIDEAKKTGAVAMFGEKYGDIVRVVSMGDFSLEFCGGTHVSNTGEIGPIKLISEGSIASGVRRIEALAGNKAWDYIASNMTALTDAAGLLKVKPIELASQVERLQEQLKQKEKLLQAREDELAILRASTLLPEQVDGVEFIGGELQGASADGLKTAADRLRGKNQNTIAVLASAVAPDKVSVAVGISDALVKRGFNAGTLAKEFASICGGGGGGKPQLAQAGGRDPAKIDQALARVKQVVLDQGSNN
ncbi:MAG TPA: alanine--tRNA ligase [Trichormus sp.]|jgi:alanyl-tRNA synthetase